MGLADGRCESDGMVQIDAASAGCARHSRRDAGVRNYRKLALRNFWRKSVPSIVTTRHISCNRERMRSPIRSPSVSLRLAALAGDNETATAAAGWSSKFVVMIVVRLLL